MATAAPAATPTATRTRTRSRRSSIRARSVQSMVKLTGHQVTIQGGQIVFRGEYQLTGGLSGVVALTWQMDRPGAEAFYAGLGDTITRAKRRAK